MENKQKEDFEIHFMSGSTSREHMHQDVEFVYVMDGRIRVMALDRHFELEDGDVMVINSNHRHSWIEMEKSHVCIIHFNYAMLLSYMEKRLIFFYCNSSMEKGDRYGGIRAIMEDLLCECVVNMERMTFQKKSLLYRLLQYLVTYFMADEVTGTAGDEQIRVEKMLQFINTNYDRTLSLQEMAETMHMAPTSFSRYFKRRVGITFIEYLNNVRLHFALEDIRYTNNSVAWIAQNHGFTNASAFCRSFKAVYGMSPMVYRKQSAGENEMPAAADENDRQFLKKYIRRNESGIWKSWQTRFKQAEMDSRSWAPWNNPWNAALNLGRATQLLSSSLRAQAAQAKAELGFTYGRICGLFDSGMQLRFEHDDHITNFNYMDMVLDFCVEQQIKPLICLGNLPETIFMDANTFVYRRPSEMIFENVAECRSVLNDFMTHIVGRYGREAVSAWKFECWYDEFYENTMGIPGPFPPVFTSVCQEIKRHVPGTAVGGCGLSVAISEEKFRNLLAAWTLEVCRPDFISINLYPYARMDLPGELRAKRRFNTDSHYQEEVLKSRNLIDACGWMDMPLYVVEWNISMSQRNPFNDTCGKAALMVQRMVSLSEVVDFAAYAGLSDYGGLYYNTNALLMGGSGLMTATGVPKPAYYALQFMGRLGKYVVKRDESYIVTTNGHGEYMILCYNAKNLRYKFYAQNEYNISSDEVDDIFEDKANLEITFTLRGLEDGAYHLKEYSMALWDCSVREAWQHMGGEGLPDPEDIRYLKNVCRPFIKKSNLKSVKGKLVFQQALGAREIKLLWLYP